MSLLISRTPLRISLLGGGTDYPSFYTEHSGRVLSFSIDKYNYLILRRLPPFFKYKNKIVYSIVEETDSIDEIQHPVIREALKYYKIEGVELIHHGDLPAGGGLASSSAFTVGLINILYRFMGQKVLSPKLLASEAIFVERHLLGERVGSQDQVCVSYGGLNKIDFFTSEDDFEFEVHPLLVPIHKIKNLEQHLMLFHTGVSRVKIASEVAKTYNTNTDLKPLIEYVDAGVKAIQHDNPKLIGELLEVSWELKKSLSSSVTNDKIDEIYQRGKKMGVIGGKLLGAGGGGFFLFCLPPERRAALLEEFSDLVHIPFSIESTGSTILLD